MRAVVHGRHGGLEVLDIVELPDPEPGPGEVVIAVRAAGVNRLDVLQREGPPLIAGFSLPHTPGMDMAGDVVELGPDVTDVAVGARVLVKPGIHCGSCGPCRRGDDARCVASRLLGGNRPGGYAERCVVPTSHVFPIPDGVSYSHAATIPTACSTAWRGLIGTGRLAIGETVLIHAAGSGVSTFATQIAVRAGARVIVTSRDPAKLDRARELGADVAIDSTSGDVVEAVKAATDDRGVDMVFDHVGPALFDASVGSLRPGGRLVFCGTTTGASTTIVLPRLYHAGLSLLGVPSQSYADFASMLEQYWRLGLSSVVDVELPLESAAEAHARLERNDFFGKIVLVP